MQGKNKRFADHGIIGLKVENGINSVYL